MDQRETVITDINISSPRKEVWAYISDQYNLRRLCEETLKAGVVFENTASPYVDDKLPLFQARVTGNDLLLSGHGCSIALRAAGEAEKTQVIVAASYDSQATMRPSKTQLNELLNRIRLDTEVREIQPAGKSRIFRSGKAEPAEETAPAQVSEKESKHIGPEPAPKTADPVEKKKRGKKTKTVVLAAAAVLVLALLAVWLLPGLGKNQGISTAGKGEGYAEKVTLEQVLSIPVGAGEADVKAALGTAGARQDEQTRLYRGPAVATEDEQGVAVQVRYQNGAVQHVTYLDIDAATVSGAFDFPAEINMLAEVAELEAAMGRHASMVRVYDQDGDEIREVHFGYLDPFANFDPAWRGEYVVIQNRTQKTARVEYWAAGDSADPLMIPSLEGTPLANQYDDYTTFLNDKYSFEKSFFMLNGYSTGDVRLLYGEYEFFSGDAGVAMYVQESEELLSDGRPAYRMSFGFDSRGRFVMFSYTNLRLADKSGMLADSKYTEVTRGMSYNEVRSLMGILPTAVVIDQNYFTLCYGERRNTEVFEEQFEFMVRFDIHNNYAQTLWDNTGSTW